MNSRYLMVALLGGLVGFACGTTGAGIGPDSAVGDAAPPGDAAHPDGATNPDGAVGPDGAVDPDGGTVGAPPECTQPSECTLVNDCCDCLAIPADETPPICEMPECFAPACAGPGITEEDLQCVAGRCSAGYSCDDTQVACLAPTPLCDPGQVPSVAGACWGPCVPVEQCVSVPACDRCVEGTFCVTLFVNIAATYHCVSDIPACPDNDCACVGPSVCVGLTNACSDGPDGPSCECPMCQ